MFNKRHFSFYLKTIVKSLIFGQTDPRQIETKANIIMSQHTISKQTYIQQGTISIAVLAVI